MAKSTTTIGHSSPTWMSAGRNKALTPKPSFATVILALFVFSCGVPVDPKWINEYEKELPKKTETQILDLSFLGDIMAHEPNYSMKNFNDIYADIKPILTEDDLTFGNLEFPIDDTIPYSTYPRFNVHTEYVEAAINGGFDVFSLANNHTNDQGRNAIEKTTGNMNALAKKYGIYWSGIREKDTDPWIVTEITVKNWKIGFWSFTEFLNSVWDTELVYLADFRRPEMEGKILDFVAAQSKNYDLFIVASHAGLEYVRYQEPYKEAFYDKLIRAGADIVWGQHAHVLQPWVQTEIDGEPKLIMYCAGNFISHQYFFQSPAGFSPTTYKGEMAIYRVTLAKNGPHTSMQVSTVPLTNYNDPEKGMVVIKMENTASAAIPEVWRKYYATRWSDFRDILYNHLEYPMIKNF